MTDDVRGFLSRITPGNWITIMLVVVAAITSWTKLDSSQTLQAGAITELKATIAKLASLDSLQNVVRDNDRDLVAVRTNLDSMRSDFKVAMDGLNARMSVLGERTNDTSREAAQLSTEISNLKDAVSELRRQASFSRFSSPSSTASDGTRSGGPR